MQITDFQVQRAQAIVKQAVADGRVPNPATVALANRDTEALAKIAQDLAQKAASAPKRKRRIRKAV